MQKSKITTKLVEFPLGDFPYLKKFHHEIQNKLMKVKTLKVNKTGELLRRANNHNIYNEYDDWYLNFFIDLESYWDCFFHSEITF